jgi:hypothetical protein
MNQSVHWSLLAGTALALLLMTPMSTRRDAVATTTFAGAAARTLHNALNALAEAADSNRNDQPEAATLALLLGGGAGAWLVHRRNSLPSMSGDVRTRR